MYGNPGASDAVAVNCLVGQAERGLHAAGAMLHRTLVHDGLGNTFIFSSNANARSSCIYDMKAGSFSGFRALRSNLRIAKRNHARGKIAESPSSAQPSISSSPPAGASSPVCTPARPSA